MQFHIEHIVVLIEGKINCWMQTKWCENTYMFIQIYTGMQLPQWLPSHDNGGPGNPRHQTTREVNEIRAKT